ncbi:hypothetical protein ACFVTT_24340 [Streptomyces niveus]|uniref:hypothetical protein n=1 Tax=Streptomyces niveus TaxID=193462 RepID=UPI00341A821A
MSDLLTNIAHWRNRRSYPEPGTPPRKLLEAASRSLSVLGLADEADLAALRAEYDPAPSPDTPPHDRPRAASDLPPTPPNSPPAGPAPSR